MRDDIRELLARLRDAFFDEVPRGHEQLADALAYLNYQSSAGSTPDHDAALETLDTEAIRRLPIQPARLDTGFCRVPVDMPAVTLYWVEDTSKVFEDRHMSPSMLDLAIKHANERLARMRRHILWLSDLSNWQPGSPFDPTETALGLGLFNKEFSGGLSIFAVRADHVHKPTWVDAGFTFYWYPAPGAPCYGQTRHLGDGRPRFREWVVWKTEARITHWSAYPAPAPDRLVRDLPSLPQTYVFQCQQEIAACRRATTGATVT